MVLTHDEILVLIDYYEAKIAYIDLRIDTIVESDASAILDPDIIEKQMDSLIDDRDVYTNRLKKLKTAANLF
mgnify:CR=1 FL=1|nr:MAG TPA: hypothetical protein [Caudoviricetes sp.]